MTEKLPEADVAIIGLGAAGSVVGHVAAKAGLQVVGLEAGPRVDAGMMTLDEIRNDVRCWLSSPKSKHEIPTWRRDASEDARPSPHPMLMVNAVGGSAVHYEGASLRFHPWHFQSRTNILKRYGQGAIPPGATTTDWPLTFEELEPYYHAVEQAIGVSGQAGNVRGKLDPRGNPFEGPRSGEFPMPPVRSSGWMESMGGAARSLGWHPFPVPAAINSQSYMGRAACTYCGFCRNNGCHVEAKGSPDVSLLPVVEATGRLRIETGARVIRIETDRDGLAAGVVYLQAGRELLQPARAVVLSSFLYENVRLLLLSRSEAHPRGLANGHGQVGKHYMAHVTPFVFGLYPGRKLNRWNGSGGQIVCVDDWNGDVFDHQGLGFVGGGMLMSMGEVRPIGAVTDPLPPSIPRWGSAWKAWLKQNAQSVGAAFAQFEPLSYEGNELDLDPVGRDSVGLPVVRVTHRIHENERRGCAFLREKLRSWLEAAGAGETWASHEIALDPRHPYGGTRLGTDPASSVVDAHGFAHEAPNLCVVGASTFATAGGHNPTLTLQALAWRSAQHLVDDWDAHHR